MTDPAETVNSFLAECAKGKDAMHAAFRTYFTPATVWENVGIATTTGVDEAIALMDGFEANFGMSHFGAEMLAIAVQGNRVLTERVDRLLTPDGASLMALRVMGIFEVADGRISAWRDYLDTAPFKAPAA